MNNPVTGKRIFVTGGAGFIGTTLCSRLVHDNEVVVFDNEHRNAMRYTELAHHPHVTFIKGDVMDAPAVKSAMEGCQQVIHLAAIAGVDTVFNHPVLTMKVNMLGTYNVLEAALAHRVERLVDFSTSEVFGSYAFRVQEADVTSLGAVGESRWTYAVSKLATEHLAHNYYKEFGLPTVSIRPFNIYGPRQVGQGAIHAFVVRALRGENLVIHNDGAQIRAWCYVDDIVDGVLLAMSRQQAVGEAFNIGNPRSVVTVYNLAKELIQLTGSKSKIVFERVDRADVELRIPSIAKAERLLGFEPKVDLEEGLRRTIDWYRGLEATEPQMAMALHA
ncbi:MAG: SDR family NAD(P)-dependent oxidoreductase [Bryobacterales bacterium]|nr:SDR family NAD(P)-dependent oxidoreductase [Bryobacterales bacterium]